VTAVPAAAFQSDHVQTDPPRLLDGKLADLLAGKKIVMTGVTGFIGEQILWKVLTQLPDTQGRRARTAQGLHDGPRARGDARQEEDLRGRT
jgi:hypothetical protein